MNKLSFTCLLIALALPTLSIRENCMIEVIQRQLRYKAFKYAQVEEEDIIRIFQIFAENGNMVQQELVQELIFNFDLLPEVGSSFFRFRL